VRKVRVLCFLILFSIFFISGCAIKDCGTNLDCFKSNAKNCSKVRANLIENDNNLRITIRGHDGDFCRISFKIEEIGEDLKRDNPVETKIALGKTMNCKINRTYSDNKQVDYINEILTFGDGLDKYCSGPIKDFIQYPLKEMVLEKLS